MTIEDASVWAKRIRTEAVETAKMPRMRARKGVLAGADGAMGDSF